MSPLFAGGYVEPGSYVQIKDVQLPALPPGTFVGALIGTGSSYKTYTNEKVTITTFAGQLLHYPVLGSPAPVVYKDTGEVAVSTVDYTLNTATGAITAVAAGINALYVTYSVTKSVLTDYEPMMFSDLQAVYNQYGVPDPDADGTIENTLSVGADIYFNNGGGLLVCVQVPDNPVESDFTAALTKLKTVDCYAIVPLCDIHTTTIYAALKSDIATHVNTMSSTIEKRERIALIGGPVTLDDRSVDIETRVAEYVNYIGATGEARLCYMVPSVASINVGALTYAISGPYIACAVAGIMCNPLYSAGEPISGKTIARLADLQDPYTRVQKNRIAAVGGFYIENKSGTFKVRHALSTNVSTAITSEIKITKIKDSISKTLRSSLDATFINTRNIGAETIAAIGTSVRLLLDGVISLRDIVSYQNLNVVQNPSEPREIDVSFQIRPTWDVNWIFITFGVTI